MNRAIMGFAAILLLATPLAADDKHVGTIDFYGYSGLDLQQLRAALPFHEGDALPSKARLEAAKEPYAKAIGRGRVEFARICCLEDGRYSLFAGIEEPGAPKIPIKPQPTGDARLPGEILQLYRDLDRENGEGVRKGQSAEDDSQGYALSSYPPARALELKLREYALAHTPELIRVSESSAADDHRETAAEALGYAAESREQIAALVGASFDPNEGVRNNAIRALGVLLDYDPAAAAQIPLQGYIALAHSIDWLDRNKSGLLFDSLTKSRDAKVLQALRAGALTPLLEMAQWKDFSHALGGVIVLGRIAGLDESQIGQAAMSKNVEPILKLFR